MLRHYTQAHRTILIRDGKGPRHKYSTLADEDEGSQQALLYPQPLGTSQRQSKLSKVNPLFCGLTHTSESTVILTGSWEEREEKLEKGEIPKSCGMKK